MGSKTPIPYLKNHLQDLKGKLEIAIRNFADREVIHNLEHQIKATESYVKNAVQPPPNKYQREIKPGVMVDVYDVLVAFNVTCPAMAHAIKKCLAPGQRGVKGVTQDKEEAIKSIQRSIEMGDAP